MTFANINQFIGKIKTAKNVNSKEIRLTLSEAEQISFELNELLLLQITQSNKIIQLQDNIMNGVEVFRDGGSF